MLSLVPFRLEATALFRNESREISEPLNIAILQVLQHGALYIELWPQIQQRHVLILVLRYCFHLVNVRQRYHGA